MQVEELSQSLAQDVALRLLLSLSDEIHDSFVHYDVLDNRCLLAEVDHAETDDEEVLRFIVLLPLEAASSELVDVVDSLALDGEELLWVR